MRFPTLKLHRLRITKAKLAVALTFVLLLPSAAVATHTFDDVDDNRFYAEPVEWAFNNGITTGTSATTFHPDRGVTRGESVTFLKRYHDNMVVPVIPSVAYVTETGLASTSSLDYAPIPSMVTDVVVPPGETWIALITFSAESQCSQDPNVSVYCYVQALVDGTDVALPDEIVFDSVRHGPNSTEMASLGSHSYTWAINLGPGYHTIEIQFRVDELDALFSVDFRTLAVEYYPIWGS